MAPVYKIAVIQLHPKPLDIEGNHASAVKYLRDAAAQGCDLAVLPEYHLTSCKYLLSYSIDLLTWPKLNLLH